MNFINKIRRVWISNSGNSKKKCNYLRKQGAVIGKEVTISGDLATFGTEPYMIEVGDNTHIAFGVKLITHDGAVRVLNNLNVFNGKRADKIAKIKIGKNVYIGMNSLVLPGVEIGNNVIIGAGSIVTKNIESDSVYVGVPAKKISTIEEYYKKNIDRFRFTKTMSYKDKKSYYESISYNNLWPGDENGK